MADGMKIYDYCPNCLRVDGIEDSGDDPEIQKGMVACTNCGWEGPSTCLVRA